MLSFDFFFFFYIFTISKNNQALVKFIIRISSTTLQLFYSLSNIHVVQIMDFFDFLHEYCEEKSETFTEF